MSKINSNKIINFLILGLILLGILVLGAVTFMPKKAHAVAFYEPYHPPSLNENSSAPANNPVPTVSSINPKSGNVGDSAKTITITGSGFVPSSVARWNGSNRPTTFIDNSHLLVNLSAGDMYGSSGRYVNVFNPGPGGGYSNAVLFTINGYNEPNATGNSTNGNSDSNSNTNTSTTTEGDTTNENSSNLASNAIFGSNGLISGLTQWILLAIIILLIVLIVRRFFGADRAYFSTPLKHD